MRTRPFVIVAITELLHGATSLVPHSASCLID
jgi:hypothetical protein